MRYADSVKEKVRELRIQGLGLNQISINSNVPKSTIRLWIKDIALTQEQKAALAAKALKALQVGRKTAQSVSSKRRVSKEHALFIKGKNEIGNLSKKELLVAGIALYWAEGFKNKHEKRLGFCNSDFDFSGQAGSGRRLEK